MNVLFIILSFVEAFFLALYLQFQLEPVVRVLLFVLILFAGHKLSQNHKHISRRVWAGSGAFSACLSVCILLGYHIHIKSAYSGLMDKNYITPYTGLDIFAGLFIFLGLWVIFAFLVWKVTDRGLFWHRSPDSLSAPSLSENQPYSPLCWRNILILCGLLFLAWLPYLLLYWPGFLFGDTLNSIQQALGNEVLDNHHPVFYTLFIRFCLHTGNMLGGGNTLGCAIYCIVQMCFMSFSFAYMICWVQVKARIKPFWCAVSGVIFAFTPYIATYSIAIWKDPVFSVSLMLLSMKLYEYAERTARTSKNAKPGAAWWTGYVFLVLLTVFSRNNGIYIIFFVDFVIVLYLLLGRKIFFAGETTKLVAVTSVLLVLSWVVINPVYNAFGIENLKVESYGVFVNQMARVAAGGGDMSEEDAAYMDSILPMELYPETYRPCCIDMLKWDENFNQEPLNHNFFRHWMSMLIKNPRIFFEAWELETCGFWTVNVPAVNQYARNIGGGSPRNLSTEYTAVLNSIDLYPDNLLGNDSLKTLFPVNEWGVPIGMISWAILFLIICMAVKKDCLQIIALAPSLGLVITLVVASPIWYWPRYGVALQFMIPFYLLLFMRGSARS